MLRRTLRRCWLPLMLRSCPAICVFVMSSWPASASSINSMSRTTPKCRQRRSEHAVTIVAAVIFAVFCSVFAAAAAQHAQASGAAGTWSTSRLHLARGFLAAASLPDRGIAMFGGGYGTSNSCYGCLSCCNLEGLAWVGCVRRVDLIYLSYAMCRWQKAN
jgi:hypothetical protein